MGSGYNKVGWVNDSPPGINAQNLGKMDTAIQNITNGSSLYYVTTNVGNAYSITSSSNAYITYVVGMTIRVKFNASNTGASTINLDGNGDMSLKINGSTDLYNGYINTDMVYTLIFNGSSFQVYSTYDLIAMLNLVSGDMLYSNGANSLTKLAKGSAYQSLNMNSAATAPQYQASLQSLITAAGDLIYGSAANTPARLAKGTDGQILGLASGLPVWENKFNLNFVNGSDNSTNVPFGAYAKTIALGCSPKYAMVTLYGRGSPADFTSLICNSSGENILVSRESNTGNIVGADHASYQYDSTAVGGLGIYYVSTRISGTNLIINLNCTEGAGTQLRLGWNITCIY